MLKVPTTARYAARAMSELARAYSRNTSVSLAKISKSQNISHKYLEHMFHRLKKSGLVKACRGARGGYRLRKNPRLISFLDIICAIDEPVLIKCLVNRNYCKKCSNCKARKVWKEASNALMHVFSKYRLSDLV